MALITKESFEDFVKKEFPDRKYKWDYQDGKGYIYIQAGPGLKYSDYELHYEYSNGKVALHIEGKRWYAISKDLQPLLVDCINLKNSKWQNHDNCQWILKSQEEDIFNLFREIAGIIEPILMVDVAEKVCYSECNTKQLFTMPLNIPKYQRIYTWKYEQVKTLLDDICNISNIDKYFVGAIILHNHFVDGKEVYDIVDGQQRIVTTALIWYQLSVISKSELADGVWNFLNCDFSSLDAQRNIADNLQIIKHYLSDEQKYMSIANNISKVHFSVLTINSAENLDLAFTFFSNTNSKGKKLTDFDLLKPHHLRYIPSDLEEQQMHLATKWDEMIDEARDVKKENAASQDDKEYIPYIRLMDKMLFRLRNWEQGKSANESEDYHVKKEFEAAPFINEIPPFGEQFKFGEPIQGGQHFFAYVDHFIDEYNMFGLQPIKKEDQETETNDEKYYKGYKDLIQTKFGRSGTNSWYGTVIEALVFCYYLKYGNIYINEATVSIVRYISIIRFKMGKANKTKICDWAKNSNLVFEINKATSPTFFLAAVENKIDVALSDTSRLELAQKGVRRKFLEICKGITDLLTENTKVTYYKNYYTNRYGMLG